MPKSQEWVVTLRQSRVFFSKTGRVDGMEAYYMIDATGLVNYDPRLVNGMTAWGGIDPSGNFNNSYWDVDHGWDGHGSFPPGPQFSYDSCLFVSGSTSLVLPVKWLTSAHRSHRLR